MKTYSTQLSAPIKEECYEQRRVEEHDYDNKKAKMTKNLDMSLSDARVLLLNRSQCCTKRCPTLVHTPAEYEYGVKWELYDVLGILNTFRAHLDI